jgi:hypothetical protein
MQDAWFNSMRFQDQETHGFPDSESQHINGSNSRRTTHFASQAERTRPSTLFGADPEFHFDSPTSIISATACLSKMAHFTVHMHQQCK